MSRLPSLCEDCGKPLPTSFRMLTYNPPTGVCHGCHEKRQIRRKRAVNTWMYLHREEINAKDVPFEVLKYCSQAFDDINTGKYGYGIGWTPMETRKIPIGPALSKYGTTCGVGNNRFSAEAIKFLVNHSDSDFVIAEIVLPDEIQNMAVRWKQPKDAVVPTIDYRDKLSDDFSDLVFDFDGSLRPDYSNYEGWDTFESE